MFVVSVTLLETKTDGIKFQSDIIQYVCDNYDREYLLEYVR